MSEQKRTLDELTAAETVSWLSKHRVQPDRIEVLVQLGVRSLDALLVASSSSGELQRQAALLRDRAPGVTFDEGALMSALAQVGHRVFADELHNLDLWLEVVAPTRQAISTSPQRAYARHVCDVIDAAIDAGRSPKATFDLVTAAAEGGLHPAEFGFGPEITGEVLRELGRVGITTAAELDLFREHGLTISEAVDFASAGIRAAAVAAASATGLPRAEWKTTLPGMPARWFRYDEFLEKVGGWDAAATLVKHGWADLDARLIVDPSNPWKGDNFSALTGSRAVQIALDGFSFAEFSRWAAILSSGSHHTYRRLLDRGRPHAYKVHEAALRLREAGVKPSHINDYRAAHCTTIYTIVDVAGRGITGKRAAMLREKYGSKRTERSRPELRSLRHLIEAHEIELGLEAKPAASE